MIVEFDKSFAKSLGKIKDVILLSKIENVITEFEKVDSISEIRSVKKLTGFKAYYRVRLGDYRLGFELLSPTKIRLIIISHRKDIYKTFP